MNEDIDRPPAGTACVTCRAMGHFCSARAFKGMTDVGVCEPCLRDEDCPVIVEMNKLRAADFIETVHMYLGERPAKSEVRIIHPQEWNPDDVVKQSTTEAEDDRIMRKGRPSTPEAVKLKIIAEPSTISSEELSRRYGLSANTIYKIRREARGNTDGRFVKAKIVEAIAPQEDIQVITRQRYKIADSIRAAILLEPLTMSNNDADIKHGVSRTSVLNIRRSADTKVAELPSYMPTPKPERPKEIKIMPHEPEPVMVKKTTAEIASDAYAELLKYAFVCEAHFQDAEQELPDALRRFLTKPVEMLELAIIPPPAVAPVEAADGSHPLLVGLVRSLPVPGTEWKSRDRLKWMDAAIKIIDLVYTDPQGEDWTYLVIRETLK